MRERKTQKYTQQIVYIYYTYIHFNNKIQHKENKYKYTVLCGIAYFRIKIFE